MSSSEEEKKRTEQIEEIKEPPNILEGLKTFLEQNPNPEAS